MSLAFDTLAYVQEMESVGFTRAQADALARNQAKLIDERLATKADLEQTRDGLELKIEQLRVELKRDIEQLRQEINSEFKLVRVEMASLEHRMTIKLGTLVVASVGIFATIMHFWH